MAGETPNAAAARGYVLRRDVVATILDHGALLLDLDSKYFYLLNPSGWAVTQLFENGASLEHVMERAHAWGANGVANSGVREMVERLISERLIEPADAIANDAGEAPAPWQPVSLERQAEPLQRVIVSAFDPSIPLAE